MVGIPIHYSRDLVIARNEVRQQISKQGIRELAFSMRVTAAVTAIVELTLAMNMTGWLHVKSISEDNSKGIELAWFGSLTQAGNGTPVDFLNMTEDMLAHLTTHVVCSNHVDGPSIELRFWTS